MYRQLILGVCADCVAATGLYMDGQARGMSFLWEDIQKIQSLWRENEKKINWVLLREIWDNWGVINIKCNNTSSILWGA